MRHLITGASGFVGGYLAQFLAGEGVAIGGLDRRSPSAPAGYQALPCDLLDFPCLLDIVAEFRPDRIFHLAGLTRPSESRIKPRDYYLVNVQGTVNILEAARQRAPQARCLLVSSGEVYGCSSLSGMIDETYSPLPNNPYGASKLLAEMVGLRYWRDFSAQVVIARPFNHAGPGQSENFVISDFCKQVAALEKERQGAAGDRRRILVGNLSSVRDFLDVRDVVAAYAGLAEKGQEGEVYNVASGQGVSIQSILDTVVGMAKIPIDVEVSPEKYRTAGNDRAVGANRRLRSLLGWRPKHSLEQTVADTLEYWRRKV
jgi:GDP-4-dehydro-6-deoxy-D-mannose reductase